MKNRLNPRTTLLTVLCLVAAGLAAAQTLRPPRGAAPGHNPASIPPLSVEQRATLLSVDSVIVPWFDDLEKGPGQWTRDGFWHLMFRPQRVSVLNPTIFPNLVVYPDSGVLPPAFSGDYAWWFGEDSNGTFIGNDFDRAQSPLSGGRSQRAISGSLVTPPVSLLGLTRALLSFQTWWEIEGVDADRFDEMFVEISLNRGLTWFLLGRGELNPLNDVNGDAWKSFSSGGLGKRGVWTQQFFDLTSYVGTVALIRFRFESGDANYNGFRGWFIDNVSVTANALPAPTIGTISPPVVNPNAIVTVTGTNFVSNATVQIDTVAVTSAVMSNTELTFNAPLTTGTKNLRIINPDGQSVTRLRALSVTTLAPPQVLTIRPDSAAAGTSVPFTITGTNLKPGAGVEIGTSILTGIAWLDSTRISGNSPATLPPGIYNVRVTNPDGLSDLLVLAFRVFTPTIRIDPVGDPSAGKTVGLNIAPPTGQAYQTGVLFFRKGGAGGFDSLALQSVPATGGFRGFFPDTIMTARGVEYWVELRRLNGNLTFPANNPAGRPAVFPVRVPVLQSPQNLPAARYRMVSTPIDLDLPFIALQLAIDYGIYNPTRWRVFGWERNGNVEVPNIKAPFAPGQAFWLITDKGIPYAVRGGTSVDTYNPRVIQLDTGWTQIGNPFAFRVGWQTVTASVPGSVRGPYWFDGAQYRMAIELLPFEGYFVRNEAPYPVQLSIPPNESIGLIGKSSVAARALAPGEFILRFAAEVPGTEFRDTYNYVGLRAAALAGDDRLDAPKPPAIGEGVLVSILDGGRAYLENFKPPGEEGQSWVVTVSGAGIKGKAVVTLTSEGVLPVGYALHVLDLVNENAVAVTAGSFEVDLTTPNLSHAFKVIMGTAAFAEKERKDIPLEPVAYMLEQNYPNPFNPETTIRYALAKRSDVTLEIYNTLGQRVRTLVEGQQGTGTYDVRWNGTNERGGQAASGVYFYRLRTGDYTAVRKLVLIR